MGDAKLQGLSSGVGPIRGHIFGLSYPSYILSSKGYLHLDPSCRSVTGKVKLQRVKLGLPDEQDVYFAWVTLGRAASCQATCPFVSRVFWLCSTKSQCSGTSPRSLMLSL